MSDLETISSGKDLVARVYAANMEFDGAQAILAGKPIINVTVRRGGSGRIGEFRVYVAGGVELSDGGTVCLPGDLHRVSRRDGRMGPMDAAARLAIIRSCSARLGARVIYTCPDQ
jgi:hypothetical protein